MSSLGDHNSPVLFFFSAFSFSLIRLCVSCLVLVVFCYFVMKHVLSYADLIGVMLFCPIFHGIMVLL